jgi:hypothetical protein
LYSNDDDDDGNNNNNNNNNTLFIFVDNMLNETAFTRQYLCQMQAPVTVILSCPSFWCELVTQAINYTQTTHGLARLCIKA